MTALTLANVISKFKAFRGGDAHTNDQLTSHINVLENTIQVEALKTYPYTYTKEDDDTITQADGTLVAYVYATDSTENLLLTGTPFEDLYVLYLIAMAYFDQEDFDKYAPAQAMFNSRYKKLLDYENKLVVRPYISVTNIW